MPGAADANDSKSETAMSPIGSESGKCSTTPGAINIAMRCVLKNDANRFNSCFEDEEDQFKELVIGHMNERDDHGKSPLEMAAILGRTEMIKELVKRGTEKEINLISEKSTNGYTCLHHAAAWGKVSSLQNLVEGGADLQQKTSNGERAREVAARYDQTECMDFLDWAEAKQNLRLAIVGMQETVTDPEKVQGRLTRDEKNQTLALCKEKLEWLDTTADASTQDFILVHQEFDEAVAAVVQKLNEPVPEKPEKK